jgi:hypothetical protein
MGNVMQYLKILTAAVFLAFPFSHAIAAAQLLPESRLWLVGDSTLHPYSTTARDIAVTLEGDFSVGGLAKNVADGKMTQLDVMIPVVKMKSEHSGLDKNLQKALKAAEYPNIVFNMSNYTVRSSTNNAGGFVIEAVGTLEVAGAKQQVTLEGTAQEKDGALEIIGAKELLMTDFGVKPPKIMMIKTANRVVIHYDLLLK